MLGHPSDNPVILLLRGFQRLFSCGARPNLQQVGLAPGSPAWLEALSLARGRRGSIGVWLSPCLGGLARRG